MPFPWRRCPRGCVTETWHLLPPVPRGQAGRLWQTFPESYRNRRDLEEVEVAAAPAFALARLLQVHAHDNPIGAARDRWPAAGYADGTQWDWILTAMQTLLPRN